MCKCFAYMHVSTMCLVPFEALRENQKPWNWSSRFYSAENANCVRRKTINALKCWAIFPVPAFSWLMIDITGPSTLWMVLPPGKALLRGTRISLVSKPVSSSVLLLQFIPPGCCLSSCLGFLQRETVTCDKIKPSLPKLFLVSILSQQQNWVGPLLMDTWVIYTFGLSE